MRILYLLGTIYVIFALTSCANTTEQSSSNQAHPAPPITPTKEKKNPLAVSFYTKEQPKVPYEVLGEESVSKFNPGGHKRQEAYIRDGMRELAAAMGGDAIINIKHDAKTITGTVVAFKETKKNEAKA
ncbi:MAG: hypothetical protein ACYCQI_12920 [Gammaproteobacteria bacterium]